ncbi:MAG: single-stranded DNA-binding protein [Bacillota bacterium]|nr:single-stranded DNA-binding protein [Bacillota bacterium]
MNTVSLVGRLVQNPEERSYDGNVTLSKFNIAVDRYFGAQKHERQSLGKVVADFPRIVVWGRQAENCCKYLKKGSLVSVQGRVITSVYEKEGENIYTTEILGEKVKFLSNRKDVDYSEESS